jgi:hypothetical protein
VSYNDSQRLASDLENAKRKYRHAAEYHQQCEKNIVELHRQWTNLTEGRAEREKDIKKCKEDFDALVKLYLNNPWVNIIGVPDPPRAPATGPMVQRVIEG